MQVMLQKAAAAKPLVANLTAKQKNEALFAMAEALISPCPY